MIEEQEGAGGRRRGLGRGLGQLFGEEAQDYAELDRLRSTKSVPIDQIYPGRFQPRKHFDEEALSSLVESIKAQGILQPILVRRHPESSNAYEIIAGERRWRAAQLAQLHEVPILIKDLPDRDALEVALVENVQRQDLNPIEEAEGYRRLVDEFGHTQEDLAKVVGKSRSHVANMMRLLALPEGVRQLVVSGQLSAGHARALIGREDAEQIASKAVARGLTVRQVERLVTTEKSGGPTGKKASPADPNTAALERDLETLLGLRVKVSFDGEKGSLTVYYGTLDQLDGLLSRITQSSGPKP
ncbi:MAG: ParB/RepB/Spo0J family partition protein [Alphaproteobacteria bacterium]|nr:ParB/RepB/Spo0J family partition protein [Alphaproteobacteria bacterium]